MRLTFVSSTAALRFTLAVGLTAALAFTVGARTATAQPKKKGGEEAGDKVLDKQMAWENKVMGEDNAKQAEMKRIAAAQKMAEEARKNPPPAPAPKVKDPAKEGVRAKQEAAIGLPIESEQAAAANTRAPKKSVKKAETASSSANDELGQLVASSLAEEKSQNQAARAQGRAGKRAPGGRGSARSPRASGSSGSSLDQLLGGSK